MRGKMTLGPLLERKTLSFFRCWYDTILSSFTFIEIEDTLKEMRAIIPLPLVRLPIERKSSAQTAMAL